MQGSDGFLKIVEVADVGLDNILVHDRYSPYSSLAFAWHDSTATTTRRRRSACSARPSGRSTPPPSPAQVAQASESKGPGDLATLLRSNGTWTVD